MCRFRCHRTCPWQNLLHIYLPTKIQLVCDETASHCHAMHLRTSFLDIMHSLLSHTKCQIPVSCHFCTLLCNGFHWDSSLHPPHLLLRWKIHQSRLLSLHYLLKFHCREISH